jgi:hypothetical protein
MINYSQMMKKHRAEIERHERLLMILERTEKRADNYSRSGKKKTPNQRHWANNVWLPMLAEAYDKLNGFSVAPQQVKN